MSDRIEIPSLLHSTSSRQSWLILLSLLVFALILTAPVSLNGHLAGYDYPVHMKWATHFTDQLSSGEIYPRWLPEMNAGMGSPAFFFYGPFPYYTTALLSTLFSPMGTAHALGMSAGIAVFVAGLTFFYWMRGKTGVLAAFAGALVYMALPYHVLIDIYERFAFAETWAFAWLPLILMATERIAAGKRGGMAFFAFSYCLLILTHLPSILIFSALPAAYLLYLCKTEDWVRSMASLAGAALLGICLSSIYFLTAMLTQGYVSMDSITRGGYFALDNFLFSEAAIQSKSKKSAEYLQHLTHVTLIAGFIAVAGMAQTYKLQNLGRPIVFWFGVSMFALFMTTPFSKPVWELISVLQKIQFPARFNVVLSLTVAATFSFGLAITLDSRISAWRIGLITCVALALAFPYLQQAKPLYWRLATTFSPPAKLFLNNFEMDEYRPRWVPIQSWIKLEKEELQKREPAFVVVKSGQAKVTNHSVSPREYHLQVRAATEATVLVNQFYYPAWSALIKNGAPLPIVPDKHWGLIQMRVPAGTYTIDLRLDRLPQERWGLWISILALMVIILSPLIRRPDQQR